MQPQLSLDFRVLEFHVAVGPRGNKTEGLGVWETHVESVQGLRMVPPLDVHAGAALGLVYEPAFYVYHQVLVQKEMRAKLLGKGSGTGQGHCEDEFCKRETHEVQM